MVEPILRKAVAMGQPVRIKYYPSVTTRALVGWRNLIPLHVYSKNGYAYLLAWYVDGSSASGGEGYRLFLMGNVQDAEVMSGAQTGSTLGMKREKELSYDYVCFRMVTRGQIE